MTERIIKEFVELSNYLGSNVAYVQGGGGNTSAKLPYSRMVVKASGMRLQDVQKNFGYANVNYDQIRKYLARAHLSEDEFAAKVAESNEIPTFSPSMETAFHAALDGFVLHSHSVFANVLNCSEEGEEVVAKLFPSAKWIPYEAPGRSLCMRVFQNSDYELFFLQNHGLIVRSKTADGAMKTHEHVNQKIRTFFSLPSFQINNSNRQINDELRKCILFPDQVVYTSTKFKQASSLVLNEITHAYDYISRHIKNLGFCSKYLTNEQIDCLESMTLEQNRAKLLSK